MSSRDRYVVENKVLVGALRSRLQVSASIRGCLCVTLSKSAHIVQQRNLMGSGYRI